MVGGHNPVAAWVVDPSKSDGCRGTSSPVRVNKGTDVKVGKHVAVACKKGVVNTGVAGRETYCSGGVERVGCDGIAGRHPGAPPIRVGGLKGIGPETNREHHLSDTVPGKVVYSVLDHGPMGHGKQLLGGGIGQRPQSSAEPPDEDDGPHGVTPSRW